MKRPTLAALLLCCVAVALPASADERILRPPFGQVPVSAGMFIEDYLARGMALLRTADPQNDGLDASDVNAVWDAMLAEARAQQVARLVAADADRDGRITRAEVTAQVVRRHNNAREEVINREVDIFMALDGNGDGVIDFDEMRKLPPKRVSAAMAERTGLDALLDLDPNGDGRLTAAEFAAILGMAFARIDVNHDTLVDEDEAAAFQKVKNPPKPPRVSKGCTLPVAGPDDRIVMVNGEPGAAADVTVGGLRLSTGSTRIEVEEGEAPVYLILVGSPVIWQVGGAVERLSHVVLLAEPGPHKLPAGGVTGVPAEKVAFDGPPGCPLPMHAAASLHGIVERARVKTALGRPVDVGFGVGRKPVVMVPDRGPQPGDGEPPLPDGFDAARWRAALLVWPAGLAHIDPATVVSKAPVEPYRVLPDLVGLAQLIGDGTLEATVDPLTFRIIRPLAAFPPGFGNYSRRMRFLVAPGGSIPEGWLDDTCIVSEQSGKPLNPHGRCPN